MANETLFPNGDDGGWTSGGWDDVNELVSSPDDGNFIETAVDGKGEVIVFDLDASGVEDADTVTNITVNIRAQLNAGGPGTVGVELLIGGVAQGTIQDTAALSVGTWSNHSLNVSQWNVDRTAAEMDGAQIRVTARQSGMPVNTQYRVSATDIVVTFDLPSGESASGDVTLTAAVAAGTAKVHKVASGAASLAAATASGNATIVSAVTTGAFPLRKIIWTEKPPEGTQIDRSHPMAEDLIFFSAMDRAGNQIDLINGKEGALVEDVAGSVQTQIQTPEGVATSIEFTAQTDLAGFDFGNTGGSGAYEPTELTLIVRCRLGDEVDTNQGSRIISKRNTAGGNDDFAIYVQDSVVAGDLISFRINGAPDDNIVKGSGDWLGFLLDVALSVDTNAQDNYLWEVETGNRQVILAQPGLTVNTGTGNLCIGHRQAEDRTFDGIVHWVAIFKKKKTEQLIDQFRNNPWQIFEPRSEPLLIGIPAAISASGAATLAAAVAAGTANVHKKASGTATLTPASAVGTARRILPANGAALLSAATASGTASVRKSASGGATLAAAVAAGTAKRVLLASGTPILTAATAAGVATRRVSANGDATLAVVTASGTASLPGGPITASGAATLTAATAAGTAKVRKSASGAATLAAATAAGTAKLVRKASGAATLEAAVGSGTTRLHRRATGATTLTAATGSGAVKALKKASGAAVLTPATASGAARRVLFTSGAATLAAITAVGAASIVTGGPAIKRRITLEGRKIDLTLDGRAIEKITLPGFLET